MGKPKVPEIAVGNCTQACGRFQGNKSDGGLSYNTGLWFWI